MPQPLRPEDLVAPIGTKPSDQFLGDVSQIESSGGKNTDHDTIENGIQGGTHASDPYGLMPNTIREMANRAKHNPESMGLPKGYSDPELTQYADPSIPASTINAALENPDFDNRAARYMQGMVQKKMGGDPEKMAYGWNMGHNIPPESITPDKLNNSDYVMKYRAIQKLRNGE